MREREILPQGKFGAWHLEFKSKYVTPAIPDLKYNGKYSFISC